MLVSTLLLAWPLQQALGTDLQSFRRAAETLLLDGGTMPAEYRSQLREMSPSDRIEAIIFLRRAGLMTDEPWPIEKLLAPPPDQPEPSK